LQSGELSHLQCPVTEAQRFVFIRRPRRFDGGVRGEDGLAARLDSVQSAQEREQLVDVAALTKKMTL